MPNQDIFTALSDPTRRHIFESLKERPLTVVEITSGQTVSRPAVSQHLKVLQIAGLVSVKPQGTRRYYQIKREGLNRLRRYLDSFWSDALSAYSAEIERQLNNK